MSAAWPLICTSRNLMLSDTAQLVLVRTTRPAHVSGVRAFRVWLLEPAVDVEHGVDGPHGVEEVDLTGMNA